MSGIDSHPIQRNDGLVANGVNLGASGTVSDRVLAWVLRAGCLAAPFALGPAIGEALRHHSSDVSIATAAAAWASWTAALIATLVLHPIGLSLVRTVAPAALLAAGAAAISGDATPASASAAVAYAAGACVAALLPATGELFVNGPAYPNERRFLLRPPGQLLVGAVEGAWVAVAGLPIAAVLLLSAGQWIAGGIAAAAAGVAGWLLGRALHGLARRWVVFVPAGVVIHDPMGLADPVLLRREVIESLVPATSASDEIRHSTGDLTRGAPGLAVELRLRERVPLPLRGAPGAGPPSATRVLVTPTRPGAVLAEAERRRIRVGVVVPRSTSD